MPTTPPDASSGARPASALMIAAYRSMRFGKPPLKFLRFDVTLRNPAAEPRWLVVPSTIEDEPFDASKERTESEVQVYQLSERPKVRIFEAISGHFWAIKLASGATLTIRSLPEQGWWSELREEAQMEVLLAREIRCDGRGLGELVPGDALSEGGDVEGPSGAGDPRALRFWHPAEGRSAPLALVVERSHRVPVSLGKPGP